MKEYAAALRKLHSSIDLSQEVQALLLLSAIDTFCQRLDEALDQPDSHHKAGYVQEKVSLFRSYCYYAVTPELGMGHKAPHEWLEAASSNLHKVELELSVP